MATRGFGLRGVAHVFQTHMFKTVTLSVGLYVGRPNASTRLTIAQSQYQLVEHQGQQDANTETKYSKEPLGRTEDAIAE